MTIVVCDMMCEMAEAQEQMWLSMLAILKEHGLMDVNFKGFMAHSAQANFNVGRKIFGSSNKNIPMPNKERTCQFHWTMALDRHTKQLIKLELQSRHIELCYEYQKCKTKVDANIAMASIKAWWYSSSACLEDALKELTSWLNFWHFRYEQWRSHMSKVIFLFSISVYIIYFMA